MQLSLRNLRARLPRRKSWAALGGAALAMLFTVVVAGPAKADPAGYSVIAYQGSDENLWYYDSSGATSTGLGMAAYTSPAIVFANDTLEMVFQSNANVLWGYWLGGYTYNSGLYMDTGTSPSIAQNFQIAFQGANDTLMLAKLGVSSLDIDNLYMAPGTSPSISADGDEVAYQGSNGDLFLYSVSFNSYVDTGLKMASETSPAIGTNDGYPNGSGSQYVVAFQANTGFLWYYDSGYIAGGTGASAHNTGLRMYSETSPTVDPDFTQEMAFDANTGQLWTYNPITNSAHSTGLALAGGKIWPSLGPYYTPSGAFEGLQTAFSAQTADYLYTYNTDGTNDNNGPTLLFDTSPAYSAGADWGDVVNEGGGGDG